MWELNHKEGWVLKKWRFQMVLEKTTESLLDYKEIKPVNPKTSRLWVFMEGLMLKLELQYFDHLLWRDGLLDQTLIFLNTEGNRRVTENKLFGWHHQLNGHNFEQTLGNGEAWKPDILQFMGLIRVGLNLVTEQQLNLYSYQLLKSWYVLP